MLTVGEAAKMLDLRPKAIRRLIRQGRLPAIKEMGPNGSMYRIALEDLEKLKANGPRSLICFQETAATAEGLPDGLEERAEASFEMAPAQLLATEANIVSLPVEMWERQQEIYNQSLVTIGQLQGQLELLHQELDERDQTIKDNNRELQKIQGLVGQNLLGQTLLPVLEEHGESLKRIAKTLVDHDARQSDMAHKTMQQLAKGEAQQLEMSKEILTKLESRDRELNQIIRAWREDREKRTAVKTTWWSRLWNGVKKNPGEKPKRRVKALT